MSYNEEAFILDFPNDNLLILLVLLSKLFTGKVLFLGCIFLYYI